MENQKKHGIGRSLGFVNIFLEAYLSTFIVIKQLYREWGQIIMMCNKILCEA